MGNDDDLLLPKQLSPVFSFPSEHLIPKADTQVLEFLQKYPHYDGRNVVVGILDTGMDPGSPSLRDFSYNNTGNENDDDSSGHHDNDNAKLLNVVDCTGAGDVDMSLETPAKWTKMKCGADGEDDDNSNDCYCWTVTGLSGQTLYLNPDWNLQPFPRDDASKDKDDDTTDSAAAAAAAVAAATTQKEDNEKQGYKDDKEEKNESEKTVPVRLAVKRGYELFPRPLRSRIQAHRKKQFQAEISKYVCMVRSKLAKLDDDNTDASSNKPSDSRSSTDDTAAAAVAALEKTKTRQDLQALLEVLNDKEWDQENTDPGPLYDCVVFYDGQQFRALLIEVCYNTSSMDKHQHQHQQEHVADKMMKNLVPLAAFDVERQYATFGVQDQYHYAVNFYDHGRVLSIVRDSSPHGSHVASICSSIEDQPQESNTSSNSGTGSNSAGDAAGIGPRRHGVAPVCILYSYKKSSLDGTCSRK
jgi:tripeptidyl-peptidase II